MDEKQKHNRSDETYRKEWTVLDGVIGAEGATPKTDTVLSNMANSQEPMSEQHTPDKPDFRKAHGGYSDKGLREAITVGTTPTEESHRRQIEHIATQCPSDSISRITGGLLSSRSDEWATPQYLFDELNLEFGFTLDPCSTDDNAKCAKHFTKAEDGLRQDWRKDIVYMNPPYGKAIKAWMQKAYEESLRGATVVCLVPSRTDTAWWHDYAMRGGIRFIRRRLKFGDGRNSAPFPSAIIIFRPKQDGFSGKEHNYG